MTERSIPALMAPPPARDNPLTRSWAGVAGIVFLVAMLLACLGSMPYTFGSEGESPRYAAQERHGRHLPPGWLYRPQVPASVDPETLPDDTFRRFVEVTRRRAGADDDGTPPPTDDALRRARPFYVLGTDILGRDLFVRVLAGGGISLTIGLSAALLSVLVGTMYGAIAGYVGGRTDAVMMRIVDILYGLPYVLLVVLLAVAADAAVENHQARMTAQTARLRAEWVEREAAAIPEAQRTADALQALRLRAIAAVPSREITPAQRQTISIVTLFVAIGGVSWLTMARVIRGQVLSLKAQPFIEAARATGVGTTGIFVRHLLPNILGPIIVYATLTVPQAILQESFLSFLGIGVKPPMPSWGNLAADGLTELNPYRSHWWLLLFPCLLLGSTLLALNFVGEGLREAFDPKRARRG